MNEHAAAIYRGRDFGVFLGSRFLSTAAMQILSVAVGWHIYEISHSTLALGLVGLSQFAPMFLLTLPAGDISDRFDQRKVLSASLLIEATLRCPADRSDTDERSQHRPLYIVLMLFGGARGFSGPAAQSLLPFIVPQERLANAIGWGSSAFQAAVIAGPALGPSLRLGRADILCRQCDFLFHLRHCSEHAGRAAAGEVGDNTRSADRVIEGVRFVWHRPVVLGAISLDLFAVLLGGATALLPVYARDILHVGPSASACCAARRRSAPH